MRGDAVRDLALRSIDDPAAAAVLSDLLEEQPQFRVLVGKLIFKHWPSKVEVHRRWPTVYYCRKPLPPGVAARLARGAAAILKRTYAQTPASPWASMPMFAKKPVDKGYWRAK